MALRNPPSWLQAGSHPAENDRLIITGLTSQTGVTGATNSMQVTATSPSSMVVNIAIGSAFVPGTARSAQGTYHCYNDAVATVTLTGSNPGLSRIDLVILRVYDSDVQGTLNTCVFETVTGTAATTPVAPSAPANSIVLAQVLVGVNAGAVDNAGITDRRTRASATGGIITVKNTSERDQIPNKYVGMHVDNIQTGTIERFNGSTWVAIGGAWQDYNPVWRNGSGNGTAIVIGNGSLSGRYKVDSAKLVTVTGRLARGTSSNLGNTFYSFDLPVIPKDFLQVVGIGWFFSTSGSNGAAAMRGINDAASYYQLVGYYNGGIIGSGSALSELRWQVSYEAA